MKLRIRVRENRRLLIHHRRRLYEQRTLPVYPEMDNKNCISEYIT